MIDNITHSSPSPLSTLNIKQEELPQQKISKEFYDIIESKFKINAKFIEGLVGDENVNQDSLLLVIDQHGSSSTDLVKSLLVVCNSLVPYNSIVSSKVLNIIWRLVISNTSNTNDKYYNQFIESLFGVVENEYGEPVNTNTKFEKLFNHLSNSISNYFNLIREYSSSNSRNIDSKRIVETFQILDKFIESSIECFREYGYEFSYLNYFTMFSTTHLMLLSEFNRNGKSKWSLSDTIVSEYKAKFTKCLKEYGEHCHNVYQNEIRNMKFTHPQYPSDYSKVYFSRDMIRVRDEWNYYNNLRNNVCSKVFDYVSLWQILGDENSNGSFKEPTRVLLSSCFGTLFKDAGYYNSNSSLQDIENEINSRRYDCYTNQLVELKIHHCARLDSVQTIHTNHLSASEPIQSEKVGGSGGSLKSISLDCSQSIRSIDISYDMVPYKLIVNGNSFGDNGHGQVWSKASLFGYKVSNFYGFGENTIGGFNSLDCLLVSYIPSYINDSNYIYSNITTYISSLKSIQTSNSSQIKSVTSAFKSGYQFNTNSNESMIYKFTPIQSSIQSSPLSTPSTYTFKLSLDIDYCNSDSSYLKIITYNSNSSMSTEYTSENDGASGSELIFTQLNNSNIIQLSNNNNNNNNTFIVMGNNIKLYNFIFTPISNQS